MSAKGKDGGDSRPLADSPVSRVAPMRTSGSSVEFFRGAAASFVNIITTFPVNKLMFRQQVEGLSLRNAFRSMKAEGWTHLYRGVLPPMLHRSMCMSVMFGLYDVYRVQLVDAEVFTNPALAGHVAAAAAGTTEALLAPLERIQTLLQTAEHNQRYAHTAHVAKSLRKYGVTEYYRGIVPIVLRNSITNTLFFALREPLRDAVPMAPDCESCKLVRAFVSGAVLGASLSTLMFPLNVAKSVMQKQVGGPHPALSTTLVDVYRTRGGFAGLYRGVSLNLTRSLVSWGIINLVYESLGTYIERRNAQVRV